MVLMNYTLFTLVRFILRNSSILYLGSLVKYIACVWFKSTSILNECILYEIFSQYMVSNANEHRGKLNPAL